MNKRRFGIIGIAVLALAAIIWGIVALVGGESKFSLPESAYGGTEQIDLTGEEYEEKLKSGENFIVFVDQSGCITADHLRTMLAEITEAKQLHVYHIMWADARNTSMHDSVKYYPSIVLVEHGQIRDFLQADSDDHVDYYQHTASLLDWLNTYIEWN